MITIDIRTDIVSHGLYARKIWEALFREVKAEKFRTLDSFLCDLRYIEEYLNGGTKVLYWSHDSEWWTTLNLVRTYEKNEYCININKDEIVIWKF